MNGSASSPTASENAASKPASAPSRRSGTAGRAAGRGEDRADLDVVVVDPPRGEQAGDEDGLGAGKDREGSGAPAEGGPHAPVEDRGVEASSSSGHRTAAIPSARTGPARLRARRIRPAIGASTKRDQCIGGAPAWRCWTRSNQGWPARRSRTSTSRMASSVCRQAQVARDREEVGPGRHADEPGQHESQTTHGRSKGDRPAAAIRTGPAERSASMTGSCGPKTGRDNRPLRTIALTPR